ncbi:hypothetical protein SAMD00023353_6700250 [Rosellinia necatrix]|uniref:Uncharacterized protein n=1 Tax=Rosellinia necatrix TaxID=77044 RepID=A0A1W2TTE1_ROSNE|nr:hypothetical protein SAMD00023353_6700250 [Rosellinia necatrix]
MNTTASKSAGNSVREERPKGEAASMFITEIKAKKIPHTLMLKQALDEIFGKEQFECEMRHNTYTIKSHRPLDESYVLAVVRRQPYPPPPQEPAQKPKRWYQSIF